MSRFSKKKKKRVRSKVHQMMETDLNGNVTLDFSNVHIRGPWQF